MKSIKPTRPIHPVWFNHIEPPRWSTWALNTTNALLKVTTIFGTRPLGRDLSFNCEFLLVSIDIHGMSIDTRFTLNKINYSQSLSIVTSSLCRSTQPVCRSTQLWHRQNQNRSPVDRHSLSVDGQTLVAETLICDFQKTFFTESHKTGNFMRF